MRTHYLPETQDSRNRAVLKRLGWIGIVQGLLVAGIVGTGFWIYASPTYVQHAPHVVSADGATDYGEALFIGPDSVVCPGNMFSSVAVDVNGNHIPAVKIRSATIGDSQVSLLQVQESGSSSSSMNPVLARAGDRLTSSSGGSGWDGSITDVKKAEYVVDPPFSLGPGFGVFAKADPSSLVGMSVGAEGRTVVVPIAAVMDALKVGIPK